VQGKTHLAFGTAVGLLALAAVSLHGSGALSGVHRLLDPQGPPTPSGWLIAALTAGGAALLPDLDQPGSLITRLPGRETRRAAATLGHSSVTRPVGTVVLTGGAVAGALLGDRPGNGNWFRRLILWTLAVALAVAAGTVRWFWVAPGIPLAPSRRSLLVLTLVVGAGLSVLAAEGGLAGLIHRLPGHHRGWTHALPFALVVVSLAWLVTGSLAPGLPGLGLACAAGYLSHLGSDALTIRGIPRWWPGENRPSLHLLPRPLRVRTGGFGERVFNVVWVPAAGYVTWLVLAR
jgi:membrane-bound metal-dependent hydrolase YbcI (DUF457 family)